MQECLDLEISYGAFLQRACDLDDFGWTPVCRQSKILVALANERQVVTIQGKLRSHPRSNVHGIGLRRRDRDGGKRGLAWRHNLSYPNCQNRLLT